MPNTVPRVVVLLVLPVLAFVLAAKVSTYFVPQEVQRCSKSAGLPSLQGEIAPAEGLNDLSCTPRRPILPIGDTIHVLEHPDATSRVLAAIDGCSAYDLEIVEEGPEFLHVRTRADARSLEAIDGWVAWKDAIPDSIAVVIDPRSGQVVSRFELPASTGSIVTSPDGTRVLLCGARTDWPHDFQLSRELREVRLLDGMTIRTARTEGSEPVIAGGYYDRGTGELVAVIVDSPAASTATLSVAAVDETGHIGERTELLTGISGLALVRNGQRALVTRESGAPAGSAEQTISLYDLVDRQTIGSVRIESANSSDLPVMLASESADTVSLVRDGMLQTHDFSTGTEISRTPVSAFDETSLVQLEPDCSGPGPLVLKSWSENMEPAAHTVDHAGLHRKSNEFLEVADVGGSRWAVGFDPRGIFQVDASLKRIRGIRVRGLVLPDGACLDYGMVISNLAGTADGQYLILSLTTGCYC